MISYLNDTARTEKRKVAWIHCNYLPDRLDRCLQLAETFLRKLGLLEDAVLVCVDNGKDQTERPRHPAWLCVQGSNRAREFSAWQEGWDAIPGSVPKVDIVILTNDTFPFHQPYHLLGPLLRASLVQLLTSEANGWALGVVERGFDYEGLSEYISSFFLVLDRKAATSVMHRMTEPVPQWRIAGDVTSGKIVESDAKRYEDSINGWLLNPAKRSWYGAAVLTRENYPAMAGKARSIILEHSLSRHLLDDDIRLISCFDLPFGFLARWYSRFDERMRTRKWFAKTHIP